MIFYFLYFGQYFITNSQKNIWWKHAATSLRLFLIFIRFQNDTTLKFNFKRLKLRCSIQKKPHRSFFLKCCSTKMQQIYRRARAQKCNILMLQSNSIKISLPHGFSLVNLLNIWENFFRRTLLRDCFGPLNKVLQNSDEP